jgi:hypothetical protein
LQATVTFLLAKGSNAIFVLVAVSPSSTDHDPTDVGTLFPEPSQSDNEIFVALKASRAAEIPLRRVYEGYHPH